MGSIVLERFAAETIPVTMKKALLEFKSAHLNLKTAAADAEDGFLKLSAAEADVAQANASLDSQLTSLAAAMVGKGLGARVRPFEGYSAHTVSAVQKLPVATKVKESRSIARKVAAKKANTSVRADAKGLAARADRAAAALGRVTAPALRMRRARTQVDAAVEPWLVSYERLQKFAAVAWIDDPGTYDSLFAPPDRVQAPRSTRSSKRKAQTTPTTASTPTSTK
jgi:hypothetical protein